MHMLYMQTYRIMYGLFLEPILNILPVRLDDNIAPWLQAISGRQRKVIRIALRPHMMMTVHSRK